MAYFFANQGTTFPILRDQGYMFTSDEEKNKRNYHALGRMLQGDKVIINDKGLVALGEVVSNRDKVPMAADFASLANAKEINEIAKKGTLGRRVDVSLQMLPKKIRYQDYNVHIQRVQSSISREKDRPFQHNGSAKESTFWYLTAEVGELLMEICGHRVRGAPSRVVGNMPPPPPPPPPPPYTPQFERRELRPEQREFRELMFEIWEVCPISGTRHERLLEAAHFKDWRYHNGSDAGMLLDARVHAALDAGLLSIALDETTDTWRVEVARGTKSAWEDLKNFDNKVFKNRIPIN